MKICQPEGFVRTALLILIAGSVLLITYVSCNDTASFSSPKDSSYDVDSATSSRVDTVIATDTALVAVDTVDLGMSEGGKMKADTSGSQPDTAQKPQSGKPAERRGVLGYSYFKKMRRNETKTINVYVTVNKSAEGVIDTVRKMQARANVSIRKNDTSSTYAVDVCLYSYLTVVLKDPSHSFAIDTLQGAPRQRIDTVNGNRWLWAVKATTEEKLANLYLIVNAEKPDGSSDHFDDQLIPVEVKIDTGNWFRKVSFYLIDNPSYVVGTILVPLIAFFGLRYFKRRDERRKNTPSNT